MEYSRICGYQPFTVTNFEELVDAVKLLPLKDQKNLAEDILLGFYELGWDVAWSAPDLMVSKTEEL
jgi:hypothetical protein